MCVRGMNGMPRQDSRGACVLLSPAGLAMYGSGSEGESSVSEDEEEKGSNKDSGSDSDTQLKV